MKSMKYHLDAKKIDFSTKINAWEKTLSNHYAALSDNNHTTSVIIYQHSGNIWQSGNLKIKKYINKFGWMRLISCHGQIKKNYSVFYFVDLFGSIFILISGLVQGWSIHTNRYSQFRKSDQLSIDEQEQILNVIARAEFIENVEQERIG